MRRGDAQRLGSRYDVTSADRTTRLPTPIMCDSADCAARGCGRVRTNATLGSEGAKSIDGVVQGSSITRGWGVCSPDGYTFRGYFQEGGLLGPYPTNCHDFSTLPPSMDSVMMIALNRRRNRFLRTDFVSALRSRFFRREPAPLRGMSSRSPRRSFRHDFGIYGRRHSREANRNPLVHPPGGHAVDRFPNGLCGRAEREAGSFQLRHVAPASS